jgi:hypothetical protein
MMAGDERSDDGSTPRIPDTRSSDVHDRLLALVRGLAREAAREVFRGEAPIDPDHGEKEMP